jgi:uncharacterized damage-inducible protein DinB
MDQPDKSIEERFQLLESKTLQLIDLISSIPREKYLQQPDPDSWSVGQAANHLYLSEKLSLAYLRKKLSYPDSVPHYHFKSRLGVLFYKLILRHVKMKAPDHINMWRGQEILSPVELNDHWSKLRIELKNFIHDHFDRFKTHLVYNHPFSGRMTFAQMIQFFSDHIDHHSRQIKRILKKIEG